MTNVPSLNVMSFSRTVYASVLVEIKDTCKSQCEDDHIDPRAKSMPLTLAS